MSCDNQMYKVLCNNSSIPTLSAGFVEMVFECLCGHFNLEPLKPKRKGQLLDAWNFAMEIGKKWRNHNLQEVRHLP